MGSVFWEALAHGRVFFERDIHAYWYPQVESFVRVVAGGSWPLWNPWVGFGAPMWADPAYQVCYPPTWLNLLLHPSIYYKVYVFLHCWGAGLGAYLLARRLGLGRLAAFVVGAVWISSGPFLSSVSLFHHFAGAAWMPWVLLALERALHGPRLGSALVLGGLGAGQLLAGSADMAFATGLMAVSRSIWFVAHRSKDRGTRARAACVVGGTACALAASLSAIQWLPTWELARSGSRLSLDTRANLYWSVHPASLLDTLAPRLLSELPVSPATRTRLFQSREPLLKCLYLGVPAAAMAGLALLVGGRGVVRLAAGFAFLVLVALGRHTPVLPLLLHVPPFYYFRYPAKYLIPASLLWALLAGFGVEAWRRGVDSRRIVLLGAALGMAALAALGSACWLTLHPELAAGWVESGQGVPAARAATAKLSAAGGLALVSAAMLAWGRVRPARAGWLGGLLALLVLGDTILSGRSVNDLAPCELLLHRPPALDALPGADTRPRVLVISYPLGSPEERVLRGPRGWQPAWAAALGQQERLQPPIAARWGVGGSYDGDFTALGPPAMPVLARGVLWRDATPLAIKLLRMGSVGHVVALHRPPSPDLEELRVFPSVFASPVRVLRVAGVLPRAYLAGRARFLPESEAFQALASPLFEPGEEVLLTDRVAPPDEASRSRGSARLVYGSTDRVGIAVETAERGYLVLTESFDRGWLATIDGEAVPVRKANLLFLSVEVPAGRHRIEFRYRPASVLAGALLAGAGALLGLGHSVWALGRSAWRRPCR